MSAPFYYERIVFLQNEEADEALRILDEKGEEKAIDYLCQWDCGDGGDIEEGSSAGPYDHTASLARYELNYDTRLGYIGLQKRLTRAEQYQWNGTRPKGDKNVKC